MTEEERFRRLHGVIHELRQPQPDRWSKSQLRTAICGVEAHESRFAAEAEPVTCRRCLHIKQYEGAVSTDQMV